MCINVWIHHVHKCLDAGQLVDFTTGVVEELAFANVRHGTAGEVGDVVLGMFKNEFEGLGGRCRGL